jgi:hypothetical protein
MLTGTLDIRGEQLPIDDGSKFALALIEPPLRADMQKMMLIQLFRDFLMRVNMERQLSEMVRHLASAGDGYFGSPEIKDIVCEHSEVLTHPDDHVDNMLIKISTLVRDPLHPLQRQCQKVCPMLWPAYQPTPSG